MEMKIKEYPLTDSFYILVFEGRKNIKYSLGRGNIHVVEDSNAVCMDFCNRKDIDVRYREILGKIPIMDEKKFVDIFNRAGVDNPYLNYLKPSENFTTCKDSFISYLQLQNWEGKLEDTWVMVKRKSKKLRGKKIPMQFDLCPEDFSRGENIVTLDVYMSYIKEDSKKCTFAVNIPDWLYNKALTNTIIEARPKLNYFESERLGDLHREMKEIVNACRQIYERDKSADKAKKVIIVNFHSSETITRDSYNHAYTGQKINTNFQFFIAYQSPPDWQGKKELFCYKEIHSGHATTDKGRKGLIDYENYGKRRYIESTPTNVIMDWTQEREDFLMELENQFRNLSDNLNLFLKDLTAEKLEKLIENKVKLLENKKDA